MVTRLVWLLCTVALTWPSPCPSTSHSRVIVFGSSSMPDMPVERSFPALAPRVTSEFRASLLQTPIDDDEAIVVFCQNLHPTLTLTAQVDGRYWSERTREIKPISYSFDVPADTFRVQRVSLERGALINLRLFSATTSGAALGDLYFIASLTKSLTGAITGRGTLLQGYANQLSQLAWPGSPIESAHEGKGRIRTFAMTSFGTTMNFVVPASRRWRVITGRWSLNLGGGAFNKSVRLNVTDGANAVYAAEALPIQTAGTLEIYGLVPGGAPAAAASPCFHVMAWPPDLELLGGYTVLFGTSIFEVIDTFAAGFVLVREWFEP